MSWQTIFVIAMVVAFAAGGIAVLAVGGTRPRAPRHPDVECTARLFDIQRGRDGAA